MAICWESLLASMARDGVDVCRLRVGFIPGTGRMGLAIARHLCNAGISVMLGSREALKASRAASSLLVQLAAAATTTTTTTTTTTIPIPLVSGCLNEEVASACDVIFWCPRGSLEEREDMLKSLAKHLQGKIIVDITNIMYFFDESEWGQTSSTLRNQKALGVPARWTTAFKATFAKALEEARTGGRTEGTFVAGDDKEAVDITIALVEKVPGFVGVLAGALQNTKIIELLGPPWVIELDQLHTNGSHLSGWMYGM